MTEAAVNGLLVEQDEAGEVSGGYLVGQLTSPGWLRANLGRVLAQVDAWVMTPLLAALGALAGDGPIHLTLVPTGRLGLLPLHAAASALAVPNLTVAYAPSALLLAQAQTGRDERGAYPIRLAGVGNPLPDAGQMAALRDGLIGHLAALPPELVASLPAVELAALLALPLAELAYAGRQVVAAAFSLALFAGERAPVGEAVGEAAGETIRLLASLLQAAIGWPQSLPHAAGELADICALLPGRAQPLYGEQATVAALTGNLAVASVLHFACHGSFDPGDPPASGLALADGLLRVADLLARDFAGLDRARLAVLSACQTAITDFNDLPDESIGLPAAFLRGGVPGVVGTLWSVADHSTRLLIGRFYHNWLVEAQPPAQALAAAQRWLRTASRDDLGAYYESFVRLTPDEAQTFQAETLLAGPGDERPYANPYYWAGFTFHGV